jgi:hypothetical protein
MLTGAFAAVVRAASAIAVLSISTASIAVPDVYPNPGTEAPASSFSAAIDGVLVGYYTGAAGGFTVLAGARIDGVDGPTGLNNQETPYGTRFVFGLVDAGDSLVFFIDVLNTGDRFFSDPALNADGVNHTWTKIYGGDALVPAGFNLAFEDLFGGGDFNYFDHSFVIGIERVLPEPGTLALLGIAAAGLGWRRRKQ